MTASNDDEFRTTSTMTTMGEAHESSSSGADVYVAETTNAASPHPPPPPPKWMKCVNGIVPNNVYILNEAVSRIANVSLSHANELITMGAVWAKLDTLTLDDALSQYYDDGAGGGGGRGGSASASIRYGDLPSGWGSGNENDELSNLPSSNSRSEGDENDEDGDGDGDGDGETLDEYVERQLSLRYRRVLTPSSIDPGTDLRIYPHPRRFPSCYELSDRARLLYEDTTFVIVDKPPMLPTQPEPSNYDECCPGCVNLLLGPFYTIGGQEVNRPLICHRIDSCVGGCLVLSKDGNGQRVFSELQASNIFAVVFSCRSL
jgi:hypothetical protein